MKIVNDLNNNSDLLSVSNKGDEESSLLGSMFSINLTSNDVKTDDDFDNFEFVFKKEDIDIINHLSNILPNVNITNLNSSDFKRVKSEIETNQSIKNEIKDKLLRVLETAKNFNKNLFFKLLDYKGNTIIKNQSLKALPSAIKSMRQGVDQSIKNSIKSNLITKNSSEIEFENSLKNQKKFNTSDQKINFVKKINKNVHPNKLYQIPNSNSLKYKEKIDQTSITDSKLSKNTNLNFINNQISDEIRKNKMNEIKANDKAFNIQNASGSNSKGNQFTQQNNTSFTNGGVNSILEGLLDTLDLSQKGWTTKLVSRIENALKNGGEDIEFNLKPKNLGKLKVSISLKNAIGNVRIITENNFVTSALTQNENFLQKLFNDQGINLEFSAHDNAKYFGSKNSFNKNPNNDDQNNFLKSDNEQKKQNNLTDLEDNVSSRHIVNVIA